MHQPDNAAERFAGDVVADYRYGYQPAQLVDYLVPLAVAGTLANTQLDREIRDTWQQDIRGEFSNDVGRIFLEVGDAGQNKISLPAYLLTMWASGYSGIDAQDNAVAIWASRSARANLIGGPQAWALTYALGAHRPGVGESDWAPWRDNDGVSGHAFYGAVPLLTAGHMSDSPGWRYTWYALSVLPAVSRINNDQHYTSQVVMGWSIAWLTTRNIAQREQGDQSGWQVQVLPFYKGGMVVFSYPL
ncbi:MAG TPA: phosphatase PAP2 family protein [Gammaproteobacteria bacterium]|nr:phosphatase PAP2 family protein [Gammaproteobacteria bacterium]